MVSFFLSLIVRKITGKRLNKFEEHKLDHEGAMEEPIKGNCWGLSFPLFPVYNCEELVKLKELDNFL